MPEIKWTGKIDDFTAHVGKYMLRIEKMDTGRWWWATIKAGTRICSGFEDTIENAKKIAIEAYEISKITKHNLNE